MKYQANCGDMVIVNSKFIGALFEKKFHSKPIITSRYTAFFIYLYFILRSKILKNIKFHIYHEGNNYFFDILWLLLSPTVYRTEYYGLKAFKQVNKEELGYSKYYQILKALRLENSFEYFKSFDDYGSSDIIWFRVKDEYVRESLEPSITSHNKQPFIHRSAILLIGKDVAADTKLIKIIDDTIECLRNADFSIALKNHPNPAFELNYSVPQDLTKIVARIDPLSPAEDYSDQFNFALGFGSTGILSFNYSISLYGFLRKSIEVEERINHLNNTAQVFQTSVFFPQNKKDLERYLCN